MNNANATLRLIATMMVVLGVSHALASDIVFVNVPGGTKTWTVEPTSGRVFAALAESDEVAEYDHTGTELRRFAIGGRADAMVIKQGRLVIACSSSNSIRLIDLNQNKLVGVVAIPDISPSGLFASAANTPFAYCFTSASGSTRNREIYQIDVTSGLVVNHSPLSGWRQPHVRNVAISADGAWMVVDGRGYLSPSGAELIKVDEREFTFTSIRNHHSDFGKIVAGPFNRFWTLGQSLYPLDLTQPLRQFSGDVVSIHPRLDLAASTKLNTLHLERFSDMHSIAKIALVPSPQTPIEPVNPRSRASVPVDDQIVGFDLPHETVFVGTKFHGYWISLVEFRQQLQPIHIINAPTEVSAMIDQQLVVDLSASNGEVGKDVELYKIAGPDGIKMEGQKAVWRPTAADVGIVNLQVGLRSLPAAPTGNVVPPLDTATIELKIRLPKIALGFLAKSMSLSPDGRYVVIWGPSVGQETRHPAHTGSDDFALVEVSTGKLLASQSIPPGIRCMAVDDKYVYVAPQSGNLFYRLDHQLKNPRRLFVQSVPTRLIPWQKNCIAVIGGVVEAFDAEQMKPLPLPDWEIGNPAQRGFNLLADDIVQVGSRVIDRSTGSLLRLAPNDLLPSLQTGGSVQRTPMHAALPSHWGRQNRGSQITNRGGNLIFQLGNGEACRIATELPLAVTVSTAYDSTLHRMQTVMRVRDLQDGAIAHSAVIDSRHDQSSQRNPHFNVQDNLMVTRSHVLYLLQDELLIATIPPDVIAKVPVPTHFLAKQVTQIPVGENSEIALRTGGEKVGTTYSLLVELPHLQVDKGTGVIAVDTQKLWKEFIDRPSQGQTIHVSPGKTVDSTDRAENASRFESITGQKLADGKMAAKINIYAGLQDREGQQDTVEFSVLIVGPRDEFDVAANQRKADLQRQQQELMKQREAVAAAKATADSTKKDEESNLTMRLDELEASMKRIEANLETILKKLE